MNTSQIMNTTIRNREELVDDEQSESYDEYDSASPALIAQVSELLNFVYGKVSVPAQIDRVSTIMRAYEGRETVLLELLETKALIKANTVKAEEAANSRDGFDVPDDISSVSGASEQNLHNFNSTVELSAPPPPPREEEKQNLEDEMNANHNDFANFSSMPSGDNKLSNSEEKVTTDTIKSSDKLKKVPDNSRTRNKAKAHVGTQKKKKGFFGLFKGGKEKSPKKKGSFQKV